jgi:hypothetical protein
MRGLTSFIADLRACRVRELEEKRINKEMAHIRQKFKGEWSSEWARAGKTRDETSYQLEGTARSGRSA